MIILKVLLIFLFIILAFILCMLFTKTRYSIDALSKPSINYIAEVSFFRGVILIKLSNTQKSGIQLFNHYLRKHSLKSNSRKEKLKNNDKKSNISIPKKEVLKEIIKYIHDIFKILKPDSVKAQGCYGFDDPYYTGIVSALLGMVVPYIENKNIRLCPIYYEEKIDIDCSIKGSVRLYFILYRTLRFLLKKDIRNFLFIKKEKMKQKTNRMCISNINDNLGGCTQ